MADDQINSDPELLKFSADFVVFIQFRKLHKLLAFPLV